MVRPGVAMASAGLLVVVLGACSGDDAIGDPAGPGFLELSVDLQEGFDGETVAVLLGDRMLASVDDVNTDPLLGLAESMTVEVPVGPGVVLGVRVGDRPVAEMAIATDRDRYVGVSLVDGAVVFVTSRDPFGYG